MVGWVVDGVVEREWVMGDNEQHRQMEMEKGEEEQRSRDRTEAPNVGFVDLAELTLQNFIWACF